MMSRPPISSPELRNMLEVVGDRHENLVKTCSFRIIGAGDNHQCKAGGMLASWKNSSDPGAPKENHVDPEKQERKQTSSSLSMSKVP